jgi:alkylated DNA repair dioxygenase AlkB
MEEESKDTVCPVKGLYLYPDYITKDEEKQLLEFCNKQEWVRELSRLTQHYGYRYVYSTRGLISAAPIPNLFQAYIDALIREKCTTLLFDQVIVNHYRPGQGIAAHTDHTHWFDKEIASLSLGSGTNMVFRKGGRRGEEYNVYLEPRTLLVMKDDARYQWTHEIQPRKMDVVDGKEIPRADRTSITFRKVKK